MGNIEKWISGFNFKQGILNGDNMNGKWISCDDLLPSPSYIGLHGFVLCCTGNQIEWGRYTSYGWHKIDGMPMEVSAWYDANYIQEILNVQV